MDLNTIISLLAQAKEFRPAAQALVDEFKEFYLPILRDAGEVILEEGTDARIRAFNRIKTECNIEDHIALALTLNLFDMFKQTKGVK